MQIDDRFGRLVVIGLIPGTRAVPAKAYVRCDCGVEKPVWRNSLAAGLTKSCGCLSRDTHRQLRKARAWLDQTTHGESRPPTVEWKAWDSMKDRCRNPNNKRWKDYGGRGIAVCHEWRDSYPAFLAHVGRRPSPAHSLDRIDNDGNYEPGNVRWATLEEQNRNRRPRSEWRNYQPAVESTT
jgi:hypothetical protein